jgi:hypothetical protein
MNAAIMRATKPPEVIEIEAQLSGIERYMSEARADRGDRTANVSN